MLIVVERCETFHHYYPIGVYTPVVLTVTILTADDLRRAAQKGHQSLKEKYGK